MMEHNQTQFPNDPFFIYSREPQEEPTPIIILCGKICSGKDTFAKQLVNHIQIDVGDIVREITQTNERIQKSELDYTITPILIERIKNSQPCVVTGIRSIKILNSLLATFDKSIIEFVWLNAPDEERKRRFVARASEKDTLSFEEYDKRDDALGIGTLERIFKNENFTISHTLHLINHY